VSLNKFIFDSLSFSWLIFLFAIHSHCLFAFREYYAKSDYKEGPLSLLHIIHNTHEKKTWLEGITLKISNTKGFPK